MSRRRLWTFRLLAATVIPVLLFAIGEGVLWLSGVGYPTAFLLPDEADSNYLVDNYKFAWRFFPRPLARSPQPIRVTEQKAPNVHRVIVLGSSAAMGDPEPAYGLPRVLEALLELRYPAHEFEVINAAVTAVNSHVVLAIARDCCRLNADAWVIYGGNNEVLGPFGAGTVFGGRRTPLRLIRCGLFMQRTRIGQLLASRISSADGTGPENWGGMQMFLDHQVRHDDPSLQRVYDNFQQNLSDILDLATDSGVHAVIGSVVSNLKDCSPFASQHARTMAEANRLEWEQQFARGCAAQASGEYAQALQAFRVAAAVDSEYAELSFRIGQCLLEVGENGEALQQFEAARDQDTLRFRADSRINEVIRASVWNRSSAVAWIDACHEFALRSPSGVTGDEFLDEHVHFNFSGNYLLAQLFAEQLVGPLGLTNELTTSSTWPSQQECAAWLGMTYFHRQIVLRELRTRFSVPPFRDQSIANVRADKLAAETSRLASEWNDASARRALEQFHRQVRERPKDWMLRQQFGELLEATGDRQGAIDQWTEITRQLPYYAEGFYRFGVLLNRAQRWELAQTALRRALELRPDYARAANSLGISLAHLSRYDDAYQQFALAVSIQPTFAESYMNWGQVLEQQGKVAEAIDRYQAALRADPDYLPAHQRLGSYLIQQRSYDRAAAHYAAVVRLKPLDPIAHLNMGLLEMKRDRSQPAKSALERVLQLDPTNPLARKALDQLRQKESRL